MPRQPSNSISPNSDDAANDMVDQVVARVLAAMQEQSNGQSQGSNQASPRVDEVKEQARQSAGGVVETVQQQAASRLDRQKEHAVDELMRVAGSVRQMGEQLKQPEQGAVSQYVAQYGDAAADQLQNFSSYLKGHDVKQLVHEVESFARREPVLFTGSAFLLGVLGARFLKSKPASEQRISAAPQYATPHYIAPSLASPEKSSSTDDSLRADSASDDATATADEDITAEAEVAASPS